MENMDERRLRLDGCKFIVDTHRRLHEKRQVYEWRVFFSTLSIYVLALAMIFSSNFHLPGKVCFVTIMCTTFLVIALSSVGLLYFIHRANAVNKRRAEHLEAKIVLLINGITPDCDEFVDKKNATKSAVEWSFFWQVLTIAIFAALSIILVLNK